MDMMHVIESQGEVAASLDSGEGVEWMYEVDPVTGQRLRSFRRTASTSTGGRSLPQSVSVAVKLGMSPGVASISGSSSAASTHNTRSVPTPGGGHLLPLSHQGSLRMSGHRVVSPTTLGRDDSQQCDETSPAPHVALDIPCDTTDSDGEDVSLDSRSISFLQDSGDVAGLHAAQAHPTPPVHPKEEAVAVPEKLRAASPRGAPPPVSLPRSSPPSEPATPPPPIPAGAPGSALAMKRRNIVFLSQQSMSCVFPSHISSPSGNDGTVGSHTVQSHEGDEAAPSQLPNGRCDMLRLEASPNGSPTSVGMAAARRLPQGGGGGGGGRDNPASPQRGNYANPSLVLETGQGPGGVVERLSVSDEGGSTTPSPPPSSASLKALPVGDCDVADSQGGFIYVIALAAHVLIGLIAVGSLVLITQT
eukprot:TRINITY_DN8265_c0_g1_i8.p1 TRINITY_DN8265_c0_g1~~TRINITY_DN8265_c0_g1_i8.p1  ORF type:complete len:461 (+),score=72.01 TRINITY_DN8265_c0_g1_i8:131-1384(+)